MFAATKKLGRGFAPQLAINQPSRSPQYCADLAPLRDPNMYARKPAADLKGQYRRSFEVATMASLALLILGFQFAHEWRSEVRTLDNPEIIIEVAEIPPTEQIQRVPPPPRPAMALPAESEDIPDDVTIETTDLNLAVLPPPPPPPQNVLDEEETEFVPYDEPPEIIGGMPALLAVLEYPLLARKASIEGTVIVGVQVDEKGRSVRTKILKEHGSKVGLEEAAVTALMKMKWKPAFQRDKPVRVWVSVPVKFTLT